MRPVERVRRQLRGVAWLAPTSGFPMLAMNVYPFYLASLQEPSAFEYRWHRFFDSRYP